MSRPTKEECAQWVRTMRAVSLEQLDFTRMDARSLAGFLERVQAALPSAAAVQRDRERRKELCRSHPWGCSCGNPECPSNPYRPE